jgi:hypothetical protein
VNDLVLAKRAADWRRLKALVLDSVSCKITKRVYNLGLDEFFEWFGKEARITVAERQGKSTASARLNCGAVLYNFWRCRHGIRIYQSTQKENFESFAIRRAQTTQDSNFNYN